MDLTKLPRPPEHHTGGHDNCLLCDYVLASRLIEMGGEPEWVRDGEPDWGSEDDSEQPEDC